MEENGSSKRSRQSLEVGEFKEESVMEEHGGSKANTAVMEDEEAPAVDDGIPEETRNLSILPGEIRYRFHFLPLKKICKQKSYSQKSEKNRSFSSSILLTCSVWQRTFSGGLFSDYFHKFEISVKFCVF